MLRFQRNSDGRWSSFIGTQECEKCITSANAFYILRPSKLERGTWFASLVMQHAHANLPNVTFEATTWVKRADSFRAAREAAIQDFEKRFVK